MATATVLTRDRLLYAVAAAGLQYLDVSVPPFGGRSTGRMGGAGLRRTRVQQPLVTQWSVDDVGA